MTNYMEQQPVRRGRPRASYAEMGEFDLSLIREFKSRPELYDRNSPLFKDKVLSAQRWQEISNKLGFAVALLKDRMLQLRNRYNIEKRRIEQLREENPHLETESSPWPLFDHLQFLSGHIRPRRSYKRLVPNVSGYDHDDEYRQDGDDEHRDNNGSRKQSYSSTEMTAPYFANVEVKEENDSEQGSEEDGDSPEEAEVLSPAQMLPPQNSTHSPEKSSSTSSALPKSITIRRLESLRDGQQHIPNPFASPPSKQIYPTYIPKHHQQQQQQLQENQNHQQQQQQYQPQPYSSSSHQQQYHQPQQQIQRHHAIQQQQHHYSPNKHSYYDNGPRYQQHHSHHHSDSYMNPPKRIKMDVRGHKYTAFGYFLASLLEELPQEKALELVQKFTSDLVEVARNSAMLKGKSEDGCMIDRTTEQTTTVQAGRSLSVGSGGGGGVRSGSVGSISATTNVGGGIVPATSSVGNSSGIVIESVMPASAMTSIPNNTVTNIAPPPLHPATIAPITDEGLELRSKRELIGM